jgi:hypothetical protein
MSRANRWFVLGDGIAREVITADIQRYLGPDALVRQGVGTGEYEGQPGYWITAYRNLTSQMIQDLKMDSQRWQQERATGETGRIDTFTSDEESTKAASMPYQDSRTHAARQHWGPTRPASVFGHGSPSSSQYGDPYRQTSAAGYGSSSSNQYGSSNLRASSSGYTTPSSYAGSSGSSVYTTSSSYAGSSGSSVYTTSSSYAVSSGYTTPSSYAGSSGSSGYTYPSSYATPSPYQYSPYQQSLPGQGVANIAQYADSRCV